jgi:hypothetical protein
MGEPTPDSFSEVQVRLSPVDGGTLFELEHTATVPPEMWDQFGPGAVGVGWDLGLLGLGSHLASGGVSIEDRDAWPVSADGRGFMTASSEAWGVAFRAAGATDEAAAGAVAATTAFYLSPGE